MEYIVAQKHRGRRHERTLLVLLAAHHLLAKYRWTGKPGCTRTRHIDNDHRRAAPIARGNRLTLYASAPRAAHDEEDYGQRR